MITALLLAFQAPVDDVRPVLWDKVRGGMTTEEIRALYPADGIKIKWHGDHQTEIEDVPILGECMAEIEIQHPKGTVDTVKVKGSPSMAGRCSDKVVVALAAKYGEPVYQSTRMRSILAREGEISVWSKDGVTMRFKLFTFGVFAGGGLWSSSWEMWYTTSATDIAL